MQEEGVKNPGTSTLRGAAFAVAAIFLFHPHGAAQQQPAAVSTTAGDTAIRELQDQVRQLQSMVDEMRAENAQSRSEMRQLRQDLQTTRALLEKPASGQSSEMAAQQLAGQAEISSSGTPENTI